jgi:hydroxyacylglutathione hydrolase
MVDAGISENIIKTELNKFGILPDQITTLLLTHTDPDHIGSTGLFRRAKIYMHKDEEQMINGEKGKFIIKSKWKYGPYQLLNSNDTFTIDGLKIKIIHTPGHSPGSSCYFINNTYLVTGDNFSCKNGKIEPFNNFFNMDTKQQIESIKNLTELDSAKYVLTAHYGMIKH